MPLNQLSRITLADLNRLADSSRQMLEKTQSEQESQAQIEYNKQLIKMLKIANSNLRQYKEIMLSPSKPKTLQVRELSHVVKEEVRNSKKSLLSGLKNEIRTKSTIKKDGGLSSRDTSRFSKNHMERSIDS
jgi:translation initiation factor 2 beta subunit (eIF-2beta)/eIF-5